MDKIKTLKVYLVTKGFSQKYGIDYKETYLSTLPSFKEICELNQVKSFWCLQFSQTFEEIGLNILKLLEL